MRKTIVLIHGMWSTPSTLTRLRKDFESRGYRVYSPSLPGREKKALDFQVNVGGLSVLDYTNHLTQYISNLNLIEAPILIGHSMGGLLALKLCAELDVAALVLLAPASPSGINIINPSSVWATFNVFTKWAFWRKPQKPTTYRARYALFNLMDRERQDALYSQLVPESGRAYFEIVFWFLDHQKATCVGPNAIKAPMLAIAGGRDRIILNGVVKKVARKYQAEYKLYKNNSHWLIDERGTEEIIEDIDSWLKRRV